MKCIVVIPALNEERTIADVLDAIPMQLFEDAVHLEKVVVDDGSTDKTAQIAVEHGASVIKHKSTQGVGSAFWSGVLEALKRRADFMVNIDGDGQMNPEDIKKLLQPILQGEADMVTASRFKNSEFVPNMSFVKRWGNRRVASIVSSIVGEKYYDVACGFRAYNKETLLRLNLKGRFTYTQETFINLANKSEVRIVEVPLVIRGKREFGKSRVASNVCKYAMKSGSIILRAFKDYKPVKFFGSLSLFFLALGGAFEIIFFLHFITTGMFSGYLWAGLTGAFLGVISIMFLVIMVVSDTLSNIIMNQEELLYYNKKREFYGENNDVQ